jgi:hypothetical protein
MRRIFAILMISVATISSVQAKQCELNEQSFKAAWSTYFLFKQQVGEQDAFQLAMKAAFTYQPNEMGAPIQLAFAIFYRSCADVIWTTLTAPKESH